MSDEFIEYEDADEPEDQFLDMEMEDRIGGTGLDDWPHADYDDWAAQYDDDPNPYHGTYSEE